MGECVYVIKDNIKYRYTMPCLICDESVDLTDDDVAAMNHGRHIRSKVCDKCKQAILHMRRCIENNEDVNTHDSCEN
jgi:hypothetical protein